MRHEFLLSRDRTAVLIVDVQEKLLGEVFGRELALKRATTLAKAATILKLPVIVTEQNPKVFGATAKAIREALGGVKPVEKMVFSCLGVDAVRDALAKLDRPQLVVFGCETHICVAQTALDAVAAGLDVHGAFDACAARTEANHLIGIEKMKAGGVIPGSTETVLYDLLERAGTDDFRAILPLLKQR